MKRLLCVVWFQRLTVKHSPTTAFVKQLLCVGWFQRLIVSHFCHCQTASLGCMVSEIDSDTFTHYCLCQMVSLCCVVSVIDSDTFTHYCLCQMASLCCVVSEIHSDTFTHYCHCQMVSLCCVVSETDSDTITHYCHRFSMPQTQWYIHPLLPLSNDFFVLCGFRDWQWHIHSLLPLSDGFFMLCGFRDWQWYIHLLLPLWNGFFMLCDFRDWQRHIHPLLPSVLHAPVPVANECRQTVVQLQCRTSPLHQAGSLTLDVACTDLFFVHLNFQTMKIRKFPPEYDHKYFFTSFAVHLFSSPEYAQFWVFGGTCLTTCYCCSVSFCVVLSVVLALNSQEFQSKACISAAKYEHSPFFWKPCWNYFQIIFTENKWNSGRKKNILTLFSIL